MTKEQVLEVVAELEEMAVRAGWCHEGTKLASTGSAYIELKRRQGTMGEWLVVRVATHKQVYGNWLTTLSWSPYELDERMIAEVLAKPFGEAGDVFEL